MLDLALDFLCFGVLFSIPVALGILLAVFHDSVLHLRNRLW